MFSFVFFQLFFLRFAKLWTLLRQIPSIFHFRFWFSYFSSILTFYLSPSYSLFLITTLFVLCCSVVNVIRWLKKELYSLHPSVSQSVNQSVGQSLLPCKKSVLLAMFELRTNHWRVKSYKRMYPVLHWARPYVCPKRMNPVLQWGGS